LTVGFGKGFRVWRQRLPEMLKEEALSSFDEFERNRTIDEMKMP
jgi:hypothetical protein